MAFESSTAMSRFFGETEPFEAVSGAKRDWSRGAVVFMMSPWLGWRPSGLVAMTILRGMWHWTEKTFHEALRKTGWSVIGVLPPPRTASASSIAYASPEDKSIAGQASFRRL